MSADPPPTFYFAPEIEQAVVSLCWHEPERLAQLYRDFDLVVHIGQPHLRIILEAINQAYGHLNTTDWASVVQLIRELGKLEHVGGLEGLNEVYQAQFYGRDNTERTEKIWADYLRLLRYYAENRKEVPPRPPDFFTSGILRLYPNKTKTLPTQPDATGEGKIGGKLYRATAWLEPDKYSQHFFKVDLIPK
jgi:hypothetical protein